MASEIRLQEGMRMKFNPCPVCNSLPFIRKEMGFGFASCRGCGLVKVMQTSADTRPLEDIWNEKAVTIALALDRYGWKRVQTKADNGRLKPVKEEKVREI